jgi:hypothetical protein
MACTQFALLKKASVPDRATLQSWIDALGFDLQLDPDLNLLTDEGFSPCVLEGVENAGFELSCEPTVDVADGDEDFLEMAGDRDTCLSLTWRSSAHDLAAATIVCCALAKHCDAVISYEGDEPETFEQLLATVPGYLENARRES